MESNHSPIAAASAEAYSAPRTAIAPNEPAVEAGRLPFIGVPTTTDNTGAGGPFNTFDLMIRDARRRGDHDRARRLQADRARINLAFRKQEVVWVPTAGQRSFYAFTAGIRSGRVGLTTARAA
jgi:hypothetical protein